MKRLSEKPQVAKSAVVESNDGQILSNPKEVLDRWKEYCEELSNHEAEKDMELLEEIILQAAPSESSEVLKKQQIPRRG